MQAQFYGSLCAAQIVTLVKILQIVENKESIGNLVNDYYSIIIITII